MDFNKIKSLETKKTDFENLNVSQVITCFTLDTTT
jgi:hypothetical protein